MEGSDLFVDTRLEKYPGFVAAIDRSTGMMLDIVVMIVTITFQTVDEFLSVKDK